jgi:hypothetical protein
VAVKDLVGAAVIAALNEKDRPCTKPFVLNAAKAAKCHLDPVATNQFSAVIVLVKKKMGAIAVLKEEILADQVLARKKCLKPCVINATRNAKCLLDRPATNQFSAVIVSAKVKEAVAVITLAQLILIPIKNN